MRRSEFRCLVPRSPESENGDPIGNDIWPPWSDSDSLCLVFFSVGHFFHHSCSFALILIYFYFIPFIPFSFISSWFATIMRLQRETKV